MTPYAHLVATGAVLATLMGSPALAQSSRHNLARERAIHDCNVLASPYVLYTWGNWQLYLYRLCMARKHYLE